MSQLQDFLKPEQETSSERRSTRRFPIQEDVHFKVLDPKGLAQPTFTGQGRSLDISSGGILFTTQNQLNIGRRLEVSILWPVCLDSGCGLKLVTTGRVVRSNGGAVAMCIERHEFRTRRIERRP